MRIMRFIVDDGKIAKYCIQCGCCIVNDLDVISPFQRTWSIAGDQAGTSEVLVQIQKHNVDD